MMQPKETCEKHSIPEMKKMFGYSNIFAVPRITKIVINTGIGRALREKGTEEEIVKQLTLITGQKPVACIARKSIASFKIRQNQVIGYKTTLRGRRMRDFFQRFVEFALPRTRDFRGFDDQVVDAGGNLTVGVREHIVFPEMIGEDARFLFGVEVTAVTNVKTREEAIALFKLQGFPLKKA